MDMRRRLRFGRQSDAEQSAGPNLVPVRPGSGMNCDSPGASSLPAKLPTLFVKAVAALGAVAVERGFDDWHGEFGGLKVIHFDAFSFECFIVLEESPQNV